jgi:predicted transcriptional regulator
MPHNSSKWHVAHRATCKNSFEKLNSNTRKIISLFMSMKFTAKKLNTLYDEKKKRNPQYSLRALARDLEINRNSLNMTMKGERRLSRKNCLKVISFLKLSVSDEKKLYKENLQDVSDGAYLEIEAKDFEKINHPEYFAILSLLKNKIKHWDLESLSKKISKNQSQTNKYLETLIGLGLIKRDGETFHRIIDGFRTTSEVSNESIRTYHKENLDIAKHSLDNIDVELRDITAVNFLLHPDKIQLVKNEIKKFRRRLVEIMENTDAEDVYSLTIGLHPISNVK